MKAFAACLLALSLLRGCGHRNPISSFASSNLILSENTAGKAPVPILTYHRFGDAATGPTTVTTSTFESQLAYLAAHGYTVIPLRQLVDWLHGAEPRPPEHAVVITVDDGHRSVYTDMLPIVRRYRIPVTLFIYPSAISNASYALTWDQLKELKDTGLFDIQSHTYWHPNFNDEKRRLNPNQYEEFVTTQLIRSKQELENKLHIHVYLLAWPFGISNEFLMTKAAQAGYIAAFALGGRQASSKDAPMSLPRYLISEQDTGARFAAILNGSSDPEAASYRGTVIDRTTTRPIQGALVTIGGTVVQTDREGAFQIRGDRDTPRVRAPGYLRVEIEGRSSRSQNLKVELAPFKPKALYLSYFGIGNSTLRESALKLIGETELNALVIDVKGDRGMISFNTSIPLAEAIGSEKRPTVRDIKALLASLKEKGIYTIARIVVFKDDPLATARPDLAVKLPSGAVWHDGEELAWTDPFKKEVWDYNIDIAVKAAEAGFDEIQFDYVRFPDARGLVFSLPNTSSDRVKAISEFLEQARHRLIPYNVFLAADAFGYVCWNANDTGFGVTLEDLALRSDYISPMLYPSGFQFGIPGYENPVTHPYEIVYLSLERARARSGLPAIRFRPWLQSFKDYAFDRRSFEADAIKSQIEASERFGSDGWMLWNPHNEYSSAGLKLKVPQASARRNAP